MSYREIKPQAKNRDEKETPNSILKLNWPPRFLISVSTLRKGKQLWATKWERKAIVGYKVGFLCEFQR